MSIYDLKPGMKVKEISSGIIATVIDAFGDGVLYLDEGMPGISPITEYDLDGFKIIEEE